MFKRFTIILIAVFMLSILLLTFSWNSIPGLEVYSSSPVNKVYRFSQDLGGKWNKYSSLKQAWAREEILKNNESFIQGLQQAGSVVIPSGNGLSVIAKSFKVSGQWGARTVQLVLEGVYGEAKVYLNGIDNINYLGEIKGMGGIYKLEIPPAALDFSQDNTILIEIIPRSVQKEKLFGWIWPEQGRITGQIRLEAVPETTLDVTELSYDYNDLSGQLIVTTVLKHHRNLDKEPWVINGVLKKEGQIIAECLLPVNSNGSYHQEVDLLFNLPEPSFWSTDNPFIYDLQLTVINSRGDMDSVHIPLGISKLTTVAGKWLLNNKQMVVEGLVLTQEEEYQIRNKRLVDEWLQARKAEGINLIYFMGFFPDESWLFAADRIGIGAWLELPVNMVPGQRIPDPDNYRGLISFDSRHPSVMAWTVGKGLENSLYTSEYLQQVKQMIYPKPVYHLSFGDVLIAGDVENIQLQESGFEGAWGHVSFNNVLSPGRHYPPPSWKEEKISAIIWLAWLSLIGISRFRSKRLDYRELFNRNPRRAVREACFWGSLFFVSRMGTFAGIITSIIFRTNVNPPPWIPYNFDLLYALQAQNPFLIWLFLTLLFTVWRLLQVGVAATAFPDSPNSLGLAIWLERRYGWIFLIALAWVLTFYYIPFYLPLVVYLLLTLIFLPLRIRDVWKIKGKYSGLLIVHLTVLTGILVACLRYQEDILYLWFMVIPQVMQAVSQSIADLSNYLITLKKLVFLQDV